MASAALNFLLYLSLMLGIITYLDQSINKDSLCYGMWLMMKLKIW